MNVPLQRCALDPPDPAFRVVNQPVHHQHDVSSGAAAALQAVPEEEQDRTRWFGQQLALHSLTWQQSTMTESAALHAIVSAAVQLVDDADGSAVVTMSAQGDLLLQAAYGAVPGRALVQQEASGWEPVTSLRPPLVTGQEWPTYQTPQARGGGDGLIAAPLGRGPSMVGTLLLFGAFGAAERVRQDVVAIAIHASMALAAIRERDNVRAAADRRDTIRRTS